MRSPELVGELVGEIAGAIAGEIVEEIVGRMWGRSCGRSSGDRGELVGKWWGSSKRAVPTGVRALTERSRSYLASELRSAGAPDAALAAEPSPRSELARLDLASASSAFHATAPY